MEETYQQLKTEWAEGEAWGETSFEVKPGSTVILDLGEVENTEPNPLPVPLLEIRHLERVTRKQRREYVGPDQAVRVMYVFTNEGQHQERVILQELDAEMVLLA